MKTLCNVIPVAGSRIDGAKTHSSEAELLDYKSTKAWLQDAFEFKAELDQLGFFQVWLSEEERAALESDSRIYSVTPRTTFAPSYVKSEETTLWHLEVASGNAVASGKFKYQSLGKGVKIYIVDSGVEATHREFGGRVVDGFNFTGAAATIQLEHGTNVAAIAAGSTVGIAREATVVSVRVGDADPYDSVDILEGLNWILSDHNTEPAVCNMSFGNYTSDAPVASAVAAMVAENIVCVAAAGNDTSTNPFYPAAYANVINVGAIQEDLDLAWFSNYGSDIDILAPGRFLVTASLNSTYIEASGTSVAAPVVAGAAACMAVELVNKTTADFQTTMDYQKQVNLSIHTDGTTTKDVINTNMHRIWHASSGPIGQLTPLKQYTLKPFYDDAGINYLTEETVVPVKRLSTVKHYGATVTNRFGLQARLDKLIPGDNPTA